MRWILALAAIISTVFLWIPLRFGQYGAVSKAAGLTFKAIPTVMCAAFAGAAWLGSREPYALLMLLGLCVGAAADVMLRVRFGVGWALFFAGHALYIAAFAGQLPPDVSALAVFVAATLLLLQFCSRYRDRIRRFGRIAAILYCMMLAALAAFSLPLLWRMPGERALLAALGSLLFVVSDMCTCHVYLGNPSEGFHRLALGIYYLAQLLLGLSAW